MRSLKFMKFKIILRLEIFKKLKVIIRLEIFFKVRNFYWDWNNFIVKKYMNLLESYEATIIKKILKNISR